MVYCDAVNLMQSGLDCIPALRLCFLDLSTLLEAHQHNTHCRPCEAALKQHKAHLLRQLRNTCTLEISTFGSDMD